MELEAEAEKLKKENQELLRKQVTNDVVTHHTRTKFASQILFLTMFFSCSTGRDVENANKTGNPFSLHSLIILQKTNFHILKLCANFLYVNNMRRG